MARPKLYANDKLKVVDPELQNLIENSRVKVYRVTWIGDPSVNWLLTEGTVGLKSYKTKSGAKQGGRVRAKSNKPSVLIFERKKDSKLGQSGVADWYYYN